MTSVWPPRSTIFSLKDQIIWILRKINTEKFVVGTISIVCFSNCLLVFVSNTLVTALQNSSECRKLTRAGTCWSKHKETLRSVVYSLSQSLMDSLRHFFYTNFIKYLLIHKLMDWYMYQQVLKPWNVPAWGFFLWFRVKNFYILLLEWLLIWCTLVCSPKVEL